MLVLVLPATSVGFGLGRPYGRTYLAREFPLQCSFPPYHGPRAKPGQVFPITFSLLLYSLPPTSPNLTFLSTCTCTFSGLSRRTLFSSPSHARSSHHHLPNTLPTVDSLIFVCVLNRLASSDCHLLTLVRRSVSHILLVIKSSSPSTRGKRQFHIGATTWKWASTESIK
jgi:hypothetical protein